MSQTLFEQLQNSFYDLILKKSLPLQLKSVECYIELSNDGKTLTMMTHLGSYRPEYNALFFDNQKFFKSSNVVVDKKHSQMTIAKKVDFSMMSPESFALNLVQFHSEIINWRKELDSSDFEKVLVKR